MVAKNRWVLVSWGLFLALLAIGLIGVVEKGPPHAYLYAGASPLSGLSIGTSDLVRLLRAHYRHVYIVTAISQLNPPPGISSCVYIAVSPEKGYGDDAPKIIEKLIECPRAGILVADEYTTSNPLLEAAGLTARVNGVPVVDANGDPYVTAYFHLLSRNISVRLDIASSVSGGVEGLGWANTGSSLVPVAVADRSPSGISAVVVGDGSIFLNQVLRIKEYADLAVSLVDYLCGSSDCAIFVEAGKYDAVPVEEVFQNPSLLRQLLPQDMIVVYSLLISKFIHPSTWFLPIIQATNQAVRGLLSDPSTSIIVLPLMFLGLFLGTERLWPKTRDEPLSEQEERVVYSTAELREIILAGKYRFVKKDFQSLYGIVNSLLLELTGMGLRDEGLADYLSKYADKRVVGKYVKRMNALYEKSVGARRLPFVFSWHRTTMKMVRESEKILSLLGTSLGAEKFSLREVE